MHGFPIGHYTRLASVVKDMLSAVTGRIADWGYLWGGLTALLNLFGPCPYLWDCWFSSNRPTGPIRSSSCDVRMCVCVSVICVSVPFRVVYFEAHFAPTSRSRMTKIFRDSESLGKSAGKKWSQNWQFVLGRSLKSPRWFCLTKHGGNHTSRWIRDLWSKGISLILAYL